MQLTWDQVFAWRLGQQFVAPPSEASVPDIVDRLCGVQAQVTSSAELAVALRRRTSEPDAVVRELNSGTLIKTWAMRGTSRPRRSP
ncbi:DNA glycosylase AlkZ-like family protein [Nocardia sp. KC 131]|uniref:DNA glycosylase AlkZ-like family protein n=1 Tax=Nocardia arseniciresistens TaxID=3392119 RepID=UPI00398ED3DB